MYGLLHIVQSYPMSQFGFWPPVLMFDVPALNDKPFQVVQHRLIFVTSVQQLMFENSLHLEPSVFCLFFL